MTGAGFQLRISRVRNAERITDITKRAEVRKSLEQDLAALLLALGVRQIPEQAWDEMRRLVDPNISLTIAFELDPDLPRRAGLAAEGQPVTVPETDPEVWQRVLASLFHAAGEAPPWRLI